MDVTLRNTLWSFSSGILLAGYDKVNAEYQLSESQGAPFAMCAMATTRSFVKWQTKRHVPTGSVIFEDGDNGRGDFIERFRSVTGRNPSMARKGEFSALEAADMLAYEHAKLVRDVASGRTKRVENIRVPLRRFEQDQRTSWVYHNELSLWALVKEAAIPPR